MRTRSTAVVGLAAVALLTSLSSCGAAQQPSSQPTAATAEPTVSSTTPTPRVASDDKPRPDIKKPHATEFTHTLVDPTHIRVEFMIGNQMCFGAYAKATETPTSVTVTVFSGTLPEAPEMCPMNAREATLLVELKEPLGQRTIVAGK